MEIRNEYEKVDAFFQHFDNILGALGDIFSRVNFDSLDLPSFVPPTLDQCFSEEEVWKAILEIPVDKAPGPDGFTGLFHRAAWPIIKADIMRAFHALWSLDCRSLYLVNQAFMVLLKKRKDANTVSGFRPISLIHSFAKLFTKVFSL